MTRWTRIQHVPAKVFTNGEDNYVLIGAEVGAAPLTYIIYDCNLNMLFKWVYLLTYQ